MNQTNISTDLPSLAQRAIANAESGLKYEKDWHQVGRDANFDRTRLAQMLVVGRLRQATRYLLDLTITCADDYARDRKIQSGPTLVLFALCSWVAEELGRYESERQLGA